MGKTKKVGSVGRFGPRYGSGVKMKLLEVERVQKSKYTCPNCFKPGLKRIAAGIWYCPKCKIKFAGKAYKPS